MDKAEKWPERKPLRLQEFDYNTAGAYFITVCTENRAKLFWLDCRGELCSPANMTLSDVGIVVDNEIQKLNTIYETICVDTYCIMPNHIHLILRIKSDIDGRTQFAPTISRVIKQFKGSISKQIGKQIWQRSFHDHVIRNQSDYDQIYEYIHNNPLRWQEDSLYLAE